MVLEDDEILFTNFTYNPDFYYFFYVGELQNLQPQPLCPEAYVRPCYIFNCSYRNPQFNHFCVPIEVGQDIVESMYGNTSGDAIPRYITTAGGKIPMHCSNVVGKNNGEYILRKPWSDEEVAYPDADPVLYDNTSFSFARYKG